MNGISHEPPEDEGLDPALIDLFDAAAAVGAHDEAFVSATLLKLEKARRTRFFVRLIVTATIVASAAVLAPYVAQVTLTAMDSLISPIGCACAALIAWRMARRRLS
jgi:hypothetical protein